MTKRAKKTATKAQFRQGDVLLIRDDTVKPGKEIAPTDGRVVLAIGETSFHCHAIDDSKAKLYELANRTESIERTIDRVLEVTKRAVMRVESTTGRTRQNERHTPVEVPVGTYLVRIQSEYSPAALRNVAD